MTTNRKDRSEVLNKPVKVVVVKSISYTGTTWLNAVMGSHQQCFLLGPADRVWQARKTGIADACLIHDEDCPFWPAFFKDYDADRNFFIQIAEQSGKQISVTNNPVQDGAGTELKHPDIEVRYIDLIRDPRAIWASYMRKSPETDPLDSIVNWLFPAVRKFKFNEDDPDRLALRYEDVLADQLRILQRIGRFIGLDYNERSLRFWEWDHHITSGNMGTISIIKMGQGIPLQNFKERAFYQDQFEAMKSKGQPRFSDERWKTELTRRNLFLYELLCGELHERFGYARDSFTLKEIMRYSQELATAYRENPAERALLSKPLLALQKLGTVKPAIGHVLQSRFDKKRAKLKKKFIKKLKKRVKI
jgi:hypothetical protein